MSSVLTDAASTANSIVLKNSDDKPQAAQTLSEVPVERRRRPRRSFMARPLGVQFREEFKLFRVR